jgi:LPXTG-site transpeptidase (sortase) family protein
VNASRIALHFGFTLLTANLVIGCLAHPLSIPQTGTPSLPAPQVHLLPTATNTPIPAPPQTTANLPSPTAAPLPETPQDLARAAYGARLIEWVRIPTLNLVAPVKAVGWSATDDLSGRITWESPLAFVGWALSSSLPGEEQGIILLYGHNNIHSSVFQRLYSLLPGDEIRLQTGQQEWLYRVSEVHLLTVLADGADEEAYARYLRPSSVPHLTLISCYPPASNTQRVVVIAQSAAQ